MLMRKLVLLRLKKTFKMKYVILIMIIFTSWGRIEAQQVYDLNHFITTGLERNFAIQVVRNREDISDNNYTRGNAGMLPLVTTTNRFGGTLNSSTQNLREGGSTSSTGIHNTSGLAGVNLGMTIFRGFEAQTTYQKLNELRLMGELNTQMSIENLVARIVSEYNYYIQQQTLYKNLAYAVSLSRERVRIDEQRYLLGAASKLQLLQSLVYLNADSSRYARQNEVLKASQIRLNELMAVEDLGETIILKDSLIQIDEELSYAELLALTLDYNTSLQIASKNQVISELDYKIIESRSYPYATLSSGYTYSYNGFETGATRNQNVRGMNYGVTLGMDLFDGYNRKREKSNALIEIENRRVQYQEVEQEVKADLLTIFYAYENNLRLLRLEEQNLEVASENLEIALEHYKLGGLSGLELREVQKSLLDAEERLISVKYQTKLAEISLLQISGRIMDYL
jgi:outer membrane protein, adhesin transport system